jgi:hypothetical protein
MLCLRHHRTGVNQMPLLPISENPPIRLATILLLGGMAWLVGAAASAQEPVPRLSNIFSVKVAGSSNAFHE